MSDFFTRYNATTYWLMVLGMLQQKGMISQDTETAARAFGMTAHSLERIYRGKQFISKAMIVVMVEKFNANPIFIYEGSGSPFLPSPSTVNS